MSKWSKDSWKNFKIKHIPQYNDPDQLEKALPDIACVGGDLMHLACFTHLLMRRKNSWS